MKRYRDFAFPRIAVGLFVGIMLFCMTIMIFRYRYEAVLGSGNNGMIDKYEKMLERYDDGDIGPEFISMMYDFYQFDYLRISQLDDDGNIIPIFETDYDIVAVSGSVHDWIYVTKDDSLAGSSVYYKQPKEDGFELNIRYLKCDEIWEPAASLDRYLSNTYNMLAFSEGWYVSDIDPFFLVSEIYGANAFPFLNIQSCYTDDAYLHLGVVKKGYMNLPFGKTWDFTEEANKDKYEQDDTEDIFGMYTSYGYPIRPDKFLSEEGDIFMQDSLADMVASGKMDYKDRGYSRTCEIDGRPTYGTIEIYETGGHKYLIESVITAQSFTEYYMPFMIGYAVFLALLFIGIPMLTAIKPYRQYKKAYENNIFKNSLIDALAHNLKTPLQVLGGYAENLKDVEGDAKNRYADAILAKTTEMNRDIEAILKAAEKTNPALAKTSVRGIVEKVVQDVGADAEIEGDAVFSIDKEYFAQALTCLIDNASRYKTVRPVEIKISTGEIIITNKTGSDSFTPGTGLAIAGRIIEQHRLKLKTEIKGGVFEAKITKK